MAYYNMKETEKRIKAGSFKGFAFQIVYMSYEKALVLNKETMKQEWVMKWQMMQHPWYPDMTEEQMIAKIETMYK